MNWLFLSPHYDDAIFSCGGLIWQLTQSGQMVEILTVCGGRPPDGELSPIAAELHVRWGVGKEVAAVRRQEDAAACSIAGARQSWLDIPDCIYRRLRQEGRPLVEKNEDLFQTDPPAEEEIISLIIERLRNEDEGTRLVCPLGVGGHIDHRLTRRAAERLGRPLSYHADFPYSGHTDAGVQELVPPACCPEKITLGSEAIDKWAEAAGCYQSQLSTFWNSRADLEKALNTYYHSNPAGHTLWVAIE